jgi:hypothetical protein
MELSGELLNELKALGDDETLTISPHRLGLLLTRTSRSRGVQRSADRALSWREIEDAKFDILTHTLGILRRQLGA